MPDSGNEAVIRVVDVLPDERAHDAWGDHRDHDEDAVKRARPVRFQVEDELRDDEGDDDHDDEAR